MAKLDEVLEGVYEAFRTPRPRHIEGCPCCTDRKMTEAMLTKPLRKLAPQDIDAYAASVFLTIGTDADYLYFMPRILELSIKMPYPEHGLNPEIALGKLKLADWGRWSKADKQAVMALIDAWFDHLIHADPADGQAIEALLCGMARAGIPLKPYLHALSNTLEALIAFCAEQYRFAEKGRLSNAFWDEASPGAAEVCDFLRSDLVRGLL